jgi:hypothetical protein
MQDVKTKTTVAFPSGAATTTSAAIDIQGGGSFVANRLFFEIQAPATPSLADAKTHTFALTDCATSGGTYTAVEGYGNMVTTGASSAGAAAKNFRLCVHPHVKRFVKLTITGISSGGDSSAVSCTFAAALG